MDLKPLLAFFAKKIIAKYKPLVIGITGSVGKTSTRRALSKALSKSSAAKHGIREPIRNYNNELGIPLTIIGTEGLEESRFLYGLIRIVFKALKIWLLPYKYPKILILEYGIDYPGDMSNLVKIVKPDIAVLTTIGVSHLENFASQADLAHEKGILGAAINKGGAYVYNFDNELCRTQAKNSNAKLISFGESDDADFKLLSTQQKLNLKPSTKINLEIRGVKLSLEIPVVGQGHVWACLTAFAVANYMELPVEQIQAGLNEYRPVPGRGNVISGIKKSILIDDTYNASPQSMQAGLSLLKDFDGSNKIAFLGDMLELGRVSEQAHKEIGKICASMFASNELHKIITVGNLAEDISRIVLQSGIDRENVLHFASSSEAAKSALQIVTENSVVLIKGSQGSRMEKITKELLAEPMRADKILCRQYGKWLHS